MEKTIFMNSDSQNGDRRLYNAADIAERFKLFTTGVVYGVEEELELTAPGNSMQTVLGIGRAEIEGYAYIHDLKNGRKTFTHDVADALLDRIDRIVIRLDLSAGTRSINAFVLKGTNAATPTAPALTQNSTIFEIPIAQVSIRRGKSFIAQSDILDERKFGFVQGMMTTKEAQTLYTYNASCVDGWYTVGTSHYEQLRIIRQYNGMCTIGGQVMGGNLGADRYVAAFSYWARPNKTIPLKVIGTDGSEGFWYLESTGNLRQTGYTPKTSNILIIPATYMGVGSTEVPGI